MALPNFSNHSNLPIFSHHLHKNHYNFDCHLAQYYLDHLWAKGHFIIYFNLLKEKSSFRLYERLSENKSKFLPWVISVRLHLSDLGFVLVFLSILWCFSWMDPYLPSIFQPKIGLSLLKIELEWSIWSL